MFSEISPKVSPASVAHPLILEISPRETMPMSCPFSSTGRRRIFSFAIISAAFSIGSDAPTVKTFRVMI